jgi:hypothetical protein
VSYETKSLLSLLAHDIAKAETVEEAYMSVTVAANVEGMQLMPYEEARKAIEKSRENNKRTV